VKKGVLMVRTWWRLPALALPLLRAACAGETPCETWED
jgi:hypothetical protein